ncbi:SLBB domain-containing protein [Thermovibrio sp.]
MRKITKITATLFTLSVTSALGQIPIQSLNQGLAQKSISLNNNLPSSLFNNSSDLSNSQLKEELNKLRSEVLKEKNLTENQNNENTPSTVSSIKQENESSYIEEGFNSRLKSLNIKLKQFGYDFFTGYKKLPTAIPVGKNYVLGPGDEILVYVIGTTPVKTPGVLDITVDREGKIYIPGAGVIYVWGMTLGEAERVISKAVGAPVKLSVGRLRTFPIYVSGEVNRPGAIVVTSVNTVIDALNMAGGVKKTGTLRDIILTRKTASGIKRIHIDLYKLLLQGKPINIKLRDGDVIFVKTIGKTAGIAGKVKRPAIYELKGNETVENLIKMAGGLLPSSYKYKVTIQRYKDNQYLELLEGNLTDKKFINQKVKDGDIVLIREVLTVPQNAILLEGYTPYPGLYQLKPGMKLSQLLTPDLFFTDTNLDFALIIRQYPPGTPPKYITFAPKDIFQKRYDIELEPSDRIIFYKLGEVKSVNFNNIKDVVVVEGEIKYPGVRAYHQGLKLSQVLTPDRVLENTNLTYGEIERRNPETLEITKIIRFSPAKVLQGKEDIELHRLDVIRFYPRYIYKPVLISGEVKKSYYVPYHKGLTLAEALTNAKFTDDIRNLKVLILRTPTKEESEKSENTTTETSSTSPNLSKLSTAPENVNLTTQFPTFSSKSFTTLENGEVSDKKPEANLSEQAVSPQEKEEETKASYFLYDVLVKREEQNIELKPGDRIVVVKVRPEEAVEKVQVAGYVKHPGVFKINEKTTLYDVLKEAGGFLPEAYPQGIIILRKSVAKMEREKLNKAINLMKQQLEKEEAGIMQSELTPEELKARQAAYEAKRKLLEEIAKFQVTGRISGIIVPKDLEKLKNSPYNILLEDGDKIFIPKRPQSVMVFGEVYNPSAFVYHKGITVREVIKLAGGLTRDADKRNIFVIKANGTTVSAGEGGSLISWDSSKKRFIWGSSESNILNYKLQPGDAVIVPTEIRVPIMWRPLIKDVVQIIYQSALTVYTISRL